MQTTKTYLYIEFENGVITRQTSGNGSLLAATPTPTPEPTPEPVKPVTPAPTLPLPPKPVEPVKPTPPVTPDFLGKLVGMRAGNTILDYTAGNGVIELADGKLFPRLSVGSVERPVGVMLPKGYGWKQTEDKAWYIEAGAPDQEGPNKTTAKPETFRPEKIWKQRPIDESTKS